MTLPWPYLGLAFAISLAISTLGFRRVFYFVSICYAFSIAAQSVAMAAVYWQSLSGWVLLQAALLLVYGLRLGIFLLVRERSPGYQKQLENIGERTAKVKGALKLTIWIGVSLLFTALFMPALLTMSAQSQGLALWSAPIGVVVMLAGLVLESWADWQKFRFKATYPSRYCDVGLYRWVRCPNYFGEMSFWFGVWLSGIAAYQSPLAWLLCTAGLVYIEVLMTAAARRVELKQDERYGTETAYLQYAQTVPVLFPFLPLYSLRRLTMFSR
jgi:steroid 5-alpha reductase family enzyme